MSTKDKRRYERWQDKRGRQKMPGAWWRARFEAKGEDGRNVYSTNYPQPCVFDELVIDDWLHLEQMDKRTWWMSVGDARIWIHVHKDGRREVTITRGEYGEICGTTEVPSGRREGHPDRKGYAR
jgi:hypothetical protein